MKKLNGTDILGIFTILLLTMITITGLLSFNIENSYWITNQYGDPVNLFGSGIYARDSYFKAPIFIGSDFTMLFLVVPMMTTALLKEIKYRTLKSKLQLTAFAATVLYYATSIAFGITYNAFHLIYIALFGCSLFLVITLMIKNDALAFQKALKWKLPTRGIRIFLTLSGISLLIAWLPDIIPTIFSGKPLPLIEVYTTEITYVLDMGIISPLMFICLGLLQKQNGLGIVLLSILLTLCVIIGAMLPIQTVFQTLAGIVLPLPVLIAKVGIFVVLAAFAAYYNSKLYKSIK